MECAVSTPPYFTHIHTLGHARVHGRNVRHRARKRTRDISRTHIDALSRIGCASYASFYLLILVRTITTEGFQIAARKNFHEL